MSGSLLAQRYAVRTPLASGGFARLFYAEDTKLGRPVAIKLLDVNSAEARHRLDREARVTGSISHPNVCAVTDQGTTGDGTPFLVMELLHGRTLGQMFAKDRLVPLDLALDIAEQLLAGLDAAHALGVVHRDVKPSNIFLSETAPGRFLVKLLDFGSAQVPGQESIDSVPLTRTGFVIGTAEYMSPEQLRGIRDFDARTDVYSAAVVLYEMLAGMRPFEGIAMPARLNSIAYHKAPPLGSLATDVPAHIARVVDTALATDRERRPARAGDLLLALRSAPPPMVEVPMTSPTLIGAVVKPKAPLTEATRIVPPNPPTRPPPRIAVPTPGSDWELETIQQPPPSFDDKG